MTTNIRERLLYCPKCGVETYSVEPAPHCDRCGVWLITVVYSAMTGKRITH